jgi:hypothetical protein
MSCHDELVEKNLQRLEKKSPRVLSMTSSCNSRTNERSVKRLKTSCKFSKPATLSNSKVSNDFDSLISDDSPGLCHDLLHRAVLPLVISLVAEVFELI